MSLNQQIADLIATAKSLGLGARDLADELLIRWGGSVPSSVVTVDEYGRHKVPGFEPWIFSPAPLRKAAELWDAGLAQWPAPLTDLQIENIKLNCGLGDAGEKKPAAFLGFSDGTNELPVSYLGGRRWTYQDVENPVIPGKFDRKWTDNGPWIPKTFRTRFETVDDAAAYFANYSGD